MNQTYNYENECERYLLGAMSEQEQSHFEEQYFENDDLFAQFLAVKDGLVDAYARDQLSADLRSQFEQHFLATEPRRQRVEQARQFIRAINKSAAAVPGAALSTSSSWWQTMPVRVGLSPMVFQGALVFLITATLLGGFLWMRNLRNRAEQARLSDQGQQFPPISTQRSPAAAEASPSVDDKQGNLGPTPPPTPSPSATRQPSQPAPAQVASLTLMPFAPRDGSSSNTLQLAADTRVVRLNLTFKNDEYSSYSISLKTLAGEEVLQRRRLKAVSVAAGNSITLIIDPTALKHQDYIITLNGLSKSGQTESLADYYFRVQRVPTK